jgi:ATP-dependent helicase/nuclease subunit A
MRLPNHEQSLAINKMDGVILSAGAGSGKTFVIIEHLIKKIENFKLSIPKSKIREEIGPRLSTFVLMTFTKKASGEMSVRLVNRIEEIIQHCSDEDSLIFWGSVLENIGRIHISTIHGFCFKLLSLKIWPTLTSELELLNEFSHKQKIKKLANEWLIKNSTSLSNTFLAHTSDLVSAMDSIFKSPELRLSFEEVATASDLKCDLDKFFKDWKELKSFEALWEEDFIFDEKQMKKGIYLLINNFIKIRNDVGEINANNFLCYIDFVNSIQRYPVAVKEMSEIERTFRLELKQLSEDLKEFGQDLINFKENYEAFSDWNKILLDIFNYINEKYLFQNGMSFSDLEYYVYKGLQSSDASKIISNQFQYIIVDEFQDTSWVQFEIIKKVINEDYQKLFCVGDLKQAIYGFRGGELEVFKKCFNLMNDQSRLSLLCNYRSSKEVIEFNNSFFHKVLPSGIKYDGIDHHSVEMMSQNIPDKNVSFGKVSKFKVNIVNNDNNANGDLAEAMGIVQVLKQKLENEKTIEVAILYRKLTSAHLLLDLLRESLIGFQSQIRIHYEEDPIISLFYHSIAYVLNVDFAEKKLSSLVLISSISKMIGLKNIHAEDLNILIENTKLLGFNQSFWKMLFSLGLSNSYFGFNAEFLESVARYSENNLNKMYHLLMKEDGSYRGETFFGENACFVNIMTAHASKGLEFDTVILAGIHTNGNYFGMKDKVGKWPKSFKWKKSYDQKKYFKSPFYYLESEVNALKDYSESKRLFYVACTRARSELIWIDLTLNGKEYSRYGNSWINALRLFDEHSIAQELSINGIADKKYRINPLYKDSLGLALYSNKRSLGLVSELSVTRFATLASCPMKFYLQNICKINSEKLFEFIEEVEKESEFYSSKKRGTKIHKILSELIESNFTNISKFKLSNKELELITYVESEIEKIQFSKKYSEVEFKFSLFGQMVTSIPDLVLTSDNDVYVIDFKTGLRENFREDSYWVQLMAYAFGFAQINPENKISKFHISLIYVDEKSTITEILSYQDISSKLQNVWKMTENLYLKNLNHCFECEYSNICQPKNSDN